MKNIILAYFDLIEVPSKGDINKLDIVTTLSNPKIATLVNNFIFYGYTPNTEAILSISLLSDTELNKFWRDIEPALKTLKGADREIGEYVVFKNFPNEVLNMTEVEYWSKQMLIYLGINKQLVTQKEKTRNTLTEIQQAKVLHLANEHSLSNIWQSLVQSKSKWSDFQNEHATTIFDLLEITHINLQDFSFKKNGLTLITELWEDIKLKKITLNIQNATDVIKLAQLLSKDYNTVLKTPNNRMVAKKQLEAQIKNAQPILKTKLQIELEAKLLGKIPTQSIEPLVPKAKNNKLIKIKKPLNTNVIHFRNFSRSERRMFLEMLETSKHLKNDMSLNKEDFKKFLNKLHPNDYKFELVKEAYNQLYNKTLKSFNTQIETKIVNKDRSVLDLISTRPGDFVRRLHHLLNVFNTETQEKFMDIIPQLETNQLLKINNYLETINNRKELLYAPNGNFTKAQITNNKKEKISENTITAISSAINQTIKERISLQFPNGINLDIKTKNVKLKEATSELTEYGRGTTFDIPPNITFIRSASYWQNTEKGSSTWFDNSWNFFDKDWKAVESCCWNNGHTFDNAAIFSGDPTNSSELNGKACQMVDLYLDKLENNNVQYAVFSILAYSHIPFNAVEEVMATLQMGENPSEGNLFEPSRCDFMFPLKGDNLTKYVLYLDIPNKKIIYTDANLYGNTNSASTNGSIIENTMPAFIESIQANPSVWDLFKNNHNPQSDIHILYSDKDTNIENKSAWVFKKENKDNKYQFIELQEVLSHKQQEKIQINTVISPKIKMMR